MTISRIVLAALCVFIITSPLFAADLYRVEISSTRDAEILKASGAEPVLREKGAYVVVADSRAAQFLANAGLRPELKAANVALDKLALDFTMGATPKREYPLVYEHDGMKLYRVDDAAFALTDKGELTYLPVKDHQPKVLFQHPKELNPGFALAEIGLDSLVGLISRDSIELFENRLQAFNGRVTGSDSCHAARDYIASKFTDFGYDSVVIDSFVWGGGNPGQNVVAYKIGTRFPNKYIIVGGHFDAVPGSPGADDNGSGTVGTLEMARVLADVETEITIVFIAFDAEETGLNGSWHYANTANANGDDIIYMLNMDMIASDRNDDFAKLFNNGTNVAYSQLWALLADSLVNITGVLSGSSGSSDHYPFAQNGFDVTFTFEYFMSNVYHQTNDSTTYLNFDYMTRMIKASLATVYVVNNAPPPVSIASIIDGGDGQSLQVNWTYGDISQLDFFRLYYTTVPATQPDSIDLSSASVSYLVEGLTDGQMYSFYVVAYDLDGRSSIAVEKVQAAPHSRPAMPSGLSAKPIRDTISLTWRSNNTELDFHHYGIIRDGVLLPGQVTDTVFEDGSPAVGYDIHEYYVVAVDDIGNASDTTGVGAQIMKAARLDRDRILAVNRTTHLEYSLANDSISGAFLREACGAFDFDYLSDTSSSNPDRAKLLDFIDYGTIIISVEGRGDELVNATGTIYGDIAYYLSIGGKAIIFGRWGSWSLVPDVDTLLYDPLSTTSVYINYFNTFYRLLPKSIVSNPGPIITSDLIGAHSQMTGYPELVWDSALTMAHTGSSYAGVAGIPLPSIPYLIGANYEALYTYNSSTDSTLTEGKTIGWRRLGGVYEYVFFDIPLSFMERNSAVQTLRKAINDLGVTLAVDDDQSPAPVPASYVLSQNFPNPFNPVTTIRFYNPESAPVDVTLDIFNILGQRVTTLFDGKAEPGFTDVIWDGKDFSGHPAATGMYFYRLKADKFADTKKMLLIK